MDEVIEAVLESPWPSEDFTQECILFRHCHYAKRERLSKKERRHPSPANFTLRPGEDALSFNWGRYADASRGHILVGLTYDKSDNFINHKDYTFFQFPYSELSIIEGVVNVKHDPSFTGNPSEVGKPNNKAHSLVFLESDDLGIRVNLSEYCNQNYEQSKCVVIHSEIDQSLDDLRARLNNTEYHRLWNFQEIV